MLDTLRKGATKGPAKVLFILLILSFGIWGIGDVVRGVGGGTAAITVGDVEVSPQRVQATFRQEVERLRRTLGPDITAERARDLGLMEATIAQLAREAVVEAAARDMGIVVSDEELRRQLAQIPAFQDQAGQFDRTLFARVLQQNNLTEAAFLQSLERDMVRDALLGSAGQGAAAPATLVAPLVAFQGEEREATAVFVDASAQELPPVPGDDALREVYQNNIEAFTAPEYRKLTALVLRPGDLADRIEVSDEALREAYEARLADLQTQESRVVQQVLVDDQQAAQAVADAAQGGATLGQAAEQAGAGAPIDLGAVTRDVLPPEAADAVFALEEGAISAPVQTPLGWHVFQVAEVRAGETPSFEAVKDDLRQQVAADRAVDELYDVTAQVEDALGGGATLEEAAQQAGLTLATIDAVDRQGLDPQGQPVAALPPEEEFLDTAFGLEEGRESLLEEIGQGYFIVRADEVTPPQPREFDAVREQVVELWQQKTRTDLAQAQAEKIAEALRAGTEPQAAAEGIPGTQVVSTPRFTRGAEQVQTDAGTLPGGVVSDLFTAEQPGAVATGRTPQGWAVAELSAIHPVEQPTQVAGFDQVQRQVRSTIADDLATQFLNAYVDRFGVEINRGVIDQTF